MGNVDNDFDFYLSLARYYLFDEKQPVPSFNNKIITIVFKYLSFISVIMRSLNRA